MIPGQPTTQQKPEAEVIVEGELSPFEHESIYRILRKGFRLEPPSYRQLDDETVATRINLVFHYPYSKEIFTEVLQENWRDLKELLKQVRYRRGKAGAAFVLSFIEPKFQLVFKSGIVDEKEMVSALDQIGHLTGIVGQMLRPDTMEQPLARVEAEYDRGSDRWHRLQGFTEASQMYVFDESIFHWVRS